MEAAAQFVVESPDVVYSPEAIEAQYEYRTTRVSREDGVLKVHPSSTRFTFRTARQVPRLGVMLVGWGGNNGSTLTAAVLANRLRLSWPTRTGRKVGVGWVVAEARAPLESPCMTRALRALRGWVSGGLDSKGLKGAQPKVVAGSGEGPLGGGVAYALSWGNLGGAYRPSHTTPTSTTLSVPRTPTPTPPPGGQLLWLADPGRHC